MVFASPHLRFVRRKTLPPARTSLRPSSLRLEVLEDRFLMSTLLVTSAADSGPQSLRQRIAQAQKGDTITFGTGLSGQTISLVSGTLDLDKDLTITGLGANHLIVSGAGQWGSVFTVACNATVSISGLTIADGRASQGGGICNVGNLTLTDCTLRDNQASDGQGGLGGGLYNEGLLTITDCTFSGNRALGGWCDPEKWDNTIFENGGKGGGLFNAPGAQAVIINSTFSGNQSLGGSGDDSGPGLGGGIFNFGASLHLINDTISQNEARGDGITCGQGGGIFRKAIDTYCTLPDVDIRNTIVAGNSADYAADVAGTFDSWGHNLIGNPQGSKGFDQASDVVNTDPLLGPLQDNGGPTPTMALLPGSPAIDHGDNNAPVPATDQRGFPRIVNKTIDIGAFEFQPVVSVTLASLENPSELGQEVTFRATLNIASGSAVPTGTVTFFDGTTALGSAPLEGLTASLSTSSLPLGDRSIIAVYNGDDEFPTSSSSVLHQTVNPIRTTTTLQSSAPVSIIGQEVTFTASVTGDGIGKGTLNGFVTFFDGATNLGSVALDGQTATLSTAALTVGQHSISALFSGNEAFLKSESRGLTQAVIQAATTVALTSSAPLSVVGLPVTFTATVQSNFLPAGIPEGIVVLKDGNTILGTASLDGGQAQFRNAPLGVGTHQISVVYEGNDRFGPSTSLTLTQVIDQATTHLVLTASAVAPTFGQPLTFTATVTAADQVPGIPTGNVIILEGASTLGEGILDNHGQVIITLSSLAAGPHQFTAVYSGNDLFTGSSAGLDILVNRASTNTLLGTAPKQVSPGSAFTLTATIISAVSGIQGPAGTVTFQDGTTILGTSSLVAGTATLALPGLAPGNHLILAQYQGNANFLGSSSSILTLNQPTPPPPNPEIDFPAPRPLGITTLRAVLVGEPIPSASFASLPALFASGSEESFVSSFSGVNADPSIAIFIPAESRPLTDRNQATIPPNDSTRTTPFRGITQKAMPSPSPDSQSTSNQTGIAIGNGTGAQPLPSDIEDKSVPKAPDSSAPASPFIPKPKDKSSAAPRSEIRGKRRSPSVSSGLLLSGFERLADPCEEGLLRGDPWLIHDLPVPAPAAAKPNSKLVHSGSLSPWWALAAGFLGLLGGGRVLSKEDDK